MRETGAGDALVHAVPDAIGPFHHAVGALVVLQPRKPHSHPSMTHPRQQGSQYLFGLHRLSTEPPEVAVTSRWEAGLEIMYAASFASAQWQRLSQGSSAADPPSGLRRASYRTRSYLCVWYQISRPSPELL